MNRPYQSAFTESLQEYCNISKSSSNTKSLRPSEILKSNKIVAGIMNTTQQQFLNPFSPDLHKDKLYNNASGFPVKDSICQSLVMLESNAENVTKDFEERLKIDSTKDKSFFSPVKKNKYLSFENANVTITIPKNGKQKDITCQRDVLCLLVSTSYTTKKPVNIEKAMSHPLTPVPLSL